MSKNSALFAALLCLFILRGAEAQGIFGGASYGLLPGFYSDYNGAVQSVFADLNGDGVIDIVTANDEYYSGTVSVVIGRGDGGFKPAFPLAVGPNPTCVAVGDFNGDGIPDIAAFGSSNSTPTVYTLYIMLGKGGGAFAPAISQTVTQNLTFLTAADVNGDGKDDLIGEANGQIAVFPGTAGGIASTPIVTACDSGGGRLAAADLDGDGKIDLIQYDRSATINYTTTVYSPSIFYGLGNGNFKPAQPLATVFPPTALTVYDINGDGKPDIVTASASDVEIILSAGRGAFFQPAAYAIANSVANAVAVADLNGDGRPDIAISAGSAYSGTGFILNTLIASSSGAYQSGTSYTLPSYTGNIYIGDVNGDGKPDLLTTDTANAAFFAGIGSGAFTAPIRNTLTNLQAVMDFNGDGKPDALSFSGNNLQVNPGVGDGTFGAPIVTPTGITINSIAVGDFNKDNKPDVAVIGLIGTSVSVSIFTGNGDGSFTLLHSYAIPGATDALAIGAGDFNGDGKPDILVVTGVPYIGFTGYQYGDTASYTLLLGDGAGGFTLKPAQKIADAVVSFQMITGDFNGDGKADFAAYYGGKDLSNMYYAYEYNVGVRVNGLGNSDGTLSVSSSQVADVYNTDPGSASFALGDFDGDGHNDLVTGLLILSGNGNGGVSGTNLAITSSKTGANSFSLASSPFGNIITGDFDGDGKTDLIINAGGLFFYSGNGDGTITASDYYNVSTSAAFAADLNGDGRLDLIGNGSVLLNAAAPVVDVYGSLTLEGLAPNAPPQIVHFTLRDGSGKTVVTRTVLVGTDGAFTLYGVPAGDYTVHIKSDKYLASNVPLHAPANSYPTLTALLRAGDANNDNSVDSSDFGVLIGAFNSSAAVPGSGYDPTADFNSDGSVDSSDFTLLIGNFNTAGDN